MKVNPHLIKRRVTLLSPAGPRVTKARARATATSLRKAARRAPAIVAQITELHEHKSTVERIPVAVISRPTWASMAATSVTRLLADMPSSIIKDRLLNEEIGVGLSVMASKILGQFDPFARTDGRKGRLMLIAPNVLAFDASFDLDSRDLHLFVAVHELTHAYQFTAAPWLEDYMIEQVSALTDTSGNLEEQMIGIQTLMSVLEGHAEYVMNNVPVTRMPSIHRIRGAMAAKRSDAHQIGAWISKVTGYSEKIAQYGTGEKFIAAIARTHGMSGVNALWADPSHLPSPAELKDPRAWMTRVLS